MVVACLFSGGKDSTFSAFWASHQGWEVKLITVVSGSDSYMFHKPNVKLCEKLSEIMGMEHEYIITKNENELNDLEDRLRKGDYEGIVSGAVESEYQKERIDFIGEKIGIPTYAPLWHRDNVFLDEVRTYFETYIVAVAGEGLTEKHLGIKFEHLPKMKHINRNLEGGEGETLVTYAPFFSKRLEIKGWRKNWDGVRGTAEAVV